MAEVQHHETPGDREMLVFEPAAILVAEDVALIKGFLEGYQLEIIEAFNGRDAVDLVRAKKPALVLMDIKMPEMNGIEASHLLKEDPETCSIPIVAATASTMKTEEEKIVAICDGILRKPITQADLLGVLAKFLKHTTTIVSPPSISEEEVCRDTEAREIHDPEGLKHKLEAELKPMWEEVKGTVIVNQVLTFAERTIAIASIHKDTRLAAWGDKLRNEAMLFNMMEMEQILAQFPGFLAPSDT